MSTRRTRAGQLGDDLGRALAAELPRREALRRIGAIIVAATIPGCSPDASTISGIASGLMPSLSEGAGDVTARNRNVIRFDSVRLHPKRIAGTDFQGFGGNRDALIANLRLQFPDDSLPNGYANDTTQGTLVQFEGRDVFKMGELQNSFSLSKKLVGGPARMFLRAKVYVPPTPPAWLEDVGGGVIESFSAQIALGNISDGLDYNYYTGPYTEISRPPGGFGPLVSGANVPGPFWTDHIQGKTSDWLMLLEAGTNTIPVRARFWCNGGVALQDENTDVVPAVSAWNLIEFQPSCSQHFSTDPINNFALFKLLEWTPWPPGAPCPYSGITT